MEKLVLPRMISSAAMCLSFVAVSLAQISIGFRQASPDGANLQLSVQYSSCSNYSAGGLNVWNSQVFTLRWSQSLGSNIITAVSNQAAFSFAMDGPPASGEDGFIYQKFTAQGSNVVQSISSGQALPVLLISTSASTADLTSFQLVTAPNSWVDANHGHANVENAVLGEQFFLFNPGLPTVSQPACSAPAQGSILVNSLNAGILEYSINNGVSYQPSPVFSNLPAGSYSIKVRLAALPGCPVSYLDNPVALAAPSPPTVSAPTVTQPTCALTSGTIVVSASGSGALQYSINNGSTWQNSNAFSGLGPGSYNIMVRLQSDVTCTAAYPANPVTINYVPSGPTVSAPTVTQPTCNLPSGTIVVNANGTGSLRYSINNGITWQNNHTFPGLNPGNYNLLVQLQSNSSCTTAYAANPVTINATPSPPAVGAPTVTQPTCALPSGTILVNASGSSTLQYSINNGVNWQSSSNFSGLSPGSYTVLARLQNNPTCTTAYAANPVTISAVPAPPSIGAPNIAQPTCALPSGTITVNASGSSTLQYSINNGVNWQSSSNFSGLSPGSYTVLARLQNNPTCTTAYAANPVIISAVPSAPLISAPTLTQPTCALPTGTIIVNASGSSNIQYSINNGSSWQGFNTFAGLSPGNYPLTVRLQSDVTCISNYASNPVSIQSPPTFPVIDSVVVVPSTLCEALGGTLTVFAPSTGLSYSINQGSTWQASSTFSNVMPGSMNVAVKRQQDNTCLTYYSENPLTIRLPPGCCPNPVYSNPCTSGDYIDDFAMGSFSKTGSGCPNNAGNLSLFSGTGPGVRLGESYPVTVKPGPNQAQYLGLYIDFNLNGSFLDAGEFINLGWIAAGGSTTIPVLIPMTATLGTGKLRIRSSRTSALTAADGCYTSLAYGETEDYDIYFYCPDNLAVNAVLAGASVHVADLEITSLGKILNGASVVFKAGESVILLPEFEVELGGVFQVSMESCY
ncbi:MAG: hypothetical protein RI973_1618 [Bacteroidota bacterium]|jgi:hypothetical protein